MKNSEKSKITITIQPEDKILRLFPKKRTFEIMDFAIPVDHRVKTQESKKINNYLDPEKEQEKNKTMEHECDGNPNWCSWNVP